jgi:hypothetical protein
MTWECSECHRPEGKGVRIDAVCHHCGKPLCLDDRVLISDNVFSELGAEAVHCRSCKNEYHPREITL